MKRMKAWTWKCCVAVLLLNAAITSADMGNEEKTQSPYFVVKSEKGDVEQFPLLFTSADVNIAGVIADVNVTQVYKNEGRTAIEALFVFPASTRAAVYGMKMTIGERVIDAQIREKDTARREYEQAKTEGKTASLLEQASPNVFQMNVANILPGDIIKVELRYTELLVPTDGVYEFVYPTVVGPRYVSPTAKGQETWVANPYLREGAAPTYLFDITTRLSAGLPIQDIGCPSHQVQIDYTDATGATVTLHEQEMIETMETMPPAHLARLEDALHELYLGRDFADLPAFYQKLSRIGMNAVRPAASPIRRQSRKHFSGDRDYVLHYRLAGGKIESGLLLYEGADENFFLLMVQPPERVTLNEIPAREYLFIVDVSGSMNGFPIQTAKTLLQNLVTHLRPTDRFNVLLFAAGSTVMSEQSVPATSENIERALHIIDNEHGGGGTNLFPALQRGFDLPATEGVSRTIVIVTDGLVNIERQAFEFIRSNLNHANVFAFGIGSSVNRYLIEGIARAGLGEPFVVTRPDEAVLMSEQFREYIQQPVLTDIQVDFGDFAAYDVEPLSIPDVLAERPIALFGKWKGQPSGSLVVQGVAGDETYRQTFRVDEISPSRKHAGLRYLWARKRIEWLDNLYASGPYDERKLELTNLGLTYNLLTEYTSFVAIDSQIRRKNDSEPHTVRQALPLPKGVSGYASGGQGVPEPGTIFLVGLGLLGIFMLRKKR